MIRTFAGAATLAFAAVVSLGGAAVAQKAEPSAALKPIIAAAQKERAVNLVMSAGIFGGSEAATRIEKEMNAMYGTSISIKYAPGPEIPMVSSQIVTDLKAKRPTRTDPFVGTNTHIPPLVAENALEAVDWTAFLTGRITKDMLEADGKAMRVYTTLPGGVVYNTQLAPSVPVKLTDLLKPEWKGKIASTPYAGSFDLLGGTDGWGVDKTLEFAKAFSGQLAGLIRCPELERLASGEFIALAPDCSGRLWEKVKQQGAPLDYAVTTDFPAIRYYYLAVPVNAEHPNAARLFCVFMMTEAGQKILWDTQYNDLHSLPGSGMGPIIKGYQAKGYKFEEYTVGWLHEHPNMDKVQAAATKIFTQR
jgi:ABC-type Fe3+ transport system substrate-binding protein